MRHLPFCLALLATVMLALAIRHAMPVDGPLANAGNAMRIVSLAPNITESICALGLEGRLAGVTRHCNWPPEAIGKPVIGGFAEPYAEALLRQQPDLAVIPAGLPELARQMHGLGIPCLEFDSTSPDRLLQSIANLGAATGCKDRADEFATKFRAAIAHARQKAAGQARPRIIFVVMHAGNDHAPLDGVCIVGRDGFYSELVKAAGGENAYQGNMPFPTLSAEAILRCNPDVVLGMATSQAEAERLLGAWKKLDGLAAVQAGRIHITTDKAHTIPGPRSLETLALLSGILHPWQKDNLQ